MRRFIRLLFYFTIFILVPGLFCDNTFANTAGQKVGNQTCADCHKVEVKTFGESLHGRVFSKKNGMGYGCESCHGPGEKHMEDQSAASIVSFGKTTAAQAEAGDTACLECHAASDELDLWAMGRHKQADVSCADCHSVHAGSKALAATTDSCLKCHKDVRSDMLKLSHHPIKENKISCNDCHNSHGTMTDAMLRGDSTNELCYKCHAERRGPFLWEHTPVEENCSNCHSPHGSNNFNLLKVRVSTLCQDCHNGESHAALNYDKGSAFGSIRLDPGHRLLVGKSCLNCHENIHGSTSPGSSFFLENSGKYFTR